MATASEVRPLVVPRLRWSFAWTLAGNVTFALLQWGMLALLAKRGSAAMVGEYALALAVSAPVFMFTNLQLRAVQVTDARDEYRFADIAALRALGSFTGLLVLAGLGWLAGWQAATWGAVGLVGVAKVIESASDVLQGAMQKQERLDAAAKSLMLRGTLVFVGFAWAFLSGNSLEIALVAAVLASLVALVIYDIPVGGMCASCVTGKATWQNVGRLARISLPLGMVMALVSLNVNVPRYALARYAGRAELGIYASLSYVVLAVNLVVTALGQAVSARLARAFSAGNWHEFKQLTARLCGMGAAIGVVGVPLAAWLGRSLLGLLYRPEYGEHMDALLLLMASAGFTAVGSFLGFAITAARVFRAQLGMMLATTGSTVIASAILVPKQGMAGAALAVLLSAVVFVTAAALVLRNTLREVDA